MTGKRLVDGVAGMVVLGFCGVGLGNELFKVERQLWEPVADDVYLQESAEKILSAGPVVSVAIFEGRCYAVINGAVHVIKETGKGVVKDKATGVIKDGGFVAAASGPTGVRALKALDGGLWALTGSGLFRFKNDAWQKLDDRVYVDLIMHGGAVHGATRDDVYRLEGETFKSIQPAGGYQSSDKTVEMADGSQVLMSKVPFGPIQRIASYHETLYALRPGQIVLFDGRIVDTNNVVDWGQLPSRTTRDLLAVGSRLLVATDRGLGVLRGAAMTALRGKDGLPYEDTTCLAAGFAGDVWIGTTGGAVRMLKDDWHFFGADHWLPGDRVNEIAVDERTVYIATDKGVGIIRYEPWTLRKKVDHYERHIDEWGHKRLGFIHTLNWGGEEKGWIREVSDNDGGHTAPYLAAMCYKYAVTGDESARAAAVDSFKAMIWLDAITPKDGFIARAIWSTTGDIGEKAKGGSGGLPAKWYPTDDGKWFWKGDTSSDEVDASFYSVSLFHDLVAKGPEKKRAALHLSRMAKHILDNGWVMRDMDGKPTRWGRWDPDYLLKPYGMYALGLNGMEAQMYMRTAYAVTGDAVFEKGFQQLLDWGYHRYTVRQKITFPPADIAPWDNNLAFRSYYTLLRYTDDPRMRSIYLRSLARTWEVMRMERVAWFNFAYGAMTGNDAEFEEAVDDLRAWPLDCIEYRYRNSHRADLGTEPGYVAYGGGTRGMSPRETSVKHESRSGLNYDGGSGRRVMEPTGFVRDYWMGRYHGFIEAPTTQDPALLRVKRGDGGKRVGALPYSGPGRPENLISGGK